VLGSVGSLANRRPSSLAFWLTDRARWSESHERAVDTEACRLAQEQGIPLVQARREANHHTNRLSESDES
jgi:hypothetical protein